MRGTAKKRRFTTSESRANEVDVKSNAGPSSKEETSGGLDGGADNTSRPISKGKEAAQPDEHKKLAELFSTEYISAMKMKENEMLDMSKTLIITDSWRNEWNRGVQVPVDSVLSAAAFRETPSDELTVKNFKLPQKLVKCNQDDKSDSVEVPNPRQEDESCRYDLDDLDSRWLALYNCQATEFGLPPLDEETTEKAIEHFESVCYDKLSERKMNDSILGIEFNEDTVCDVCQAPESEDQNEMVFCDSCNVAVHQTCYGIPQVPTGTWFCRACAAGVKPTCILCPNTGGAFKSTRSGTRWCHVSCALWIPEVGFHDPEYMEPVTNIAGIPESRWLLRCSLCRERRRGACVQCEFKGCSTPFHVTCAQRQKLTFELLPSVDVAGNETVAMKQYCLKHSDHPAAKPFVPDDSGVLTKESHESQRAKRLEEIEDEFFTCVDPVAAAENLQLDPFIVYTLYEYWKLKRKSNFNKPLMRAKKEEDQIMERQQEDILGRKIRMLIYLRQNLETARNLCYMVVKREKTKKQWYQSVESIFNSQSSLLENSAVHLTSRDLASLLKTFDSGDSAYDRLLRISRQQNDTDGVTTITRDLKSPESSAHTESAPQSSVQPTDSDLGSDSDKSGNSVKLREKKTAVQSINSPLPSKSPSVSPTPRKQKVVAAEVKDVVDDRAPAKEATSDLKSQKRSFRSPEYPAMVTPRRTSLRQKSGGAEDGKEKPSESSADNTDTGSDTSTEKITEKRSGKLGLKKRKGNGGGSADLPSPPTKRALRSVPSRRTSSL